LRWTRIPSREEISLAASIAKLIEEIAHLLSH